MIWSYTLLHANLLCFITLWHCLGLLNRAEGMPVPANPLWRMNIKIVILQVWGWRCSLFFLLSRNPMKRINKINNELILLTSIVCVTKAWCSLFLCAIELHCWPRTIKNTSVTHIIAHWHVHYSEHKHCSLFSVNPTYTYIYPKWVLIRSWK